jgi:outer membrane lipoprotein carrier protein
MITKLLSLSISGIILLVISLNTLANSPADQLKDMLIQAPALSAKVVHSTYKYNERKNSKTLMQQLEAHLYLEQPLKFNWQVAGEFAQTVICDGITSWFYEADLNQVIIQPLKDKDLAQTPILLLSSQPDNIEKKFSVTASHTSNTTSFELLAKNPSNMFSKVIILFRQGLISNMTLHDKMYNIISLDFTQVKQLQSLPDKLFTFVLPKGVDIIR